MEILIATYKKYQSFFDQLFIALIGYLIVQIKYSPILAAPGDFLFRNNGDGLKNYYSFAYHVKYGNSWHFDGMNYPYGESVFFTDNQPLLAMILNFINSYMVDISDHSIGFLNIWLLFIPIFSALAFYHLFRYLGVNLLFAVSFGLIITYLSPQMARIPGHYSLSYAFYFPIYILLLLKIKSKKDLINCFLASIVIICGGLTHIYFFIILGSLGLAYAFMNLFISNQKTKYQQSILILSSVVFSAIVLFLSIYFFDPITDRPASPWGINSYNATFRGTFFPHYGPVKEWISPWIEMGHIFFERNNYVGIIGFLFLFVLLGRIIQRIVRNKDIWIIRNRQVLNLFVSSFIVWLYAIGFFFTITDHAILDWIPLLKQFRGTGRVGWAFYYGFSIFFFYYYYLIISSLIIRNKKILAYGLAISLIGISVFEVKNNLDSNVAFLFNKNRELHRKNNAIRSKLEERNLKPDDFQAILSVPLFILGSEKLHIERGPFAMIETFKASYELGLPIINFNMSRTSINHALTCAQLFSHPDIKKERVADMDDRPILILKSSEKLLAEEDSLVNKAQFLFEEGKYEYYSLDIEAFEPTNSNLHPMLSNEDKAKLIKSEESLVGYNALYEFQTDSLGIIPDYPLWLYIDRETPVRPDISIEYFNHSDELIHQERFDYNLVTNVIDYWIEINHKFQQIEGTHKIRIHLSSPYPFYLRNFNLSD